MLKKTMYHRRKNRGLRFTQKRVKPTVTVGLVHANWCGHCQALKPEWKKMKKGKNGKGRHFIEIEDSDAQKDAKVANINKRLKGEKLAVSGFPTIFKIDKGRLEYYQGERTAEHMHKWSIGGSNEIPTPEPTPEPTQAHAPAFMQRMFGGCGCSSTLQK